MQEGKDVRFPEGQSTVSGTLYMAGQDHMQLMNDAYTSFAHTNPMHGDVFPSVRRMESEVVNMTASLLGGGALGCVPISSRRMSTASVLQSAGSNASDQLSSRMFLMQLHTE